MSGRLRARLLIAAVAVIVMAPILIHYWDSWRQRPLGAAIWLGEIVGLIAIAFVLAPILLRVMRVAAWVYLAIGVFLARTIMVTLAMVHRDKGGEAQAFEQKRVLPALASWMRYGADEEAVKRSLTAERLTGWIVAAWPLVILPFILEETTPLLLVVIGVAPFIVRNYRTRTEEVKNAVSKAFQTEDPPGPAR